MARPRIYPWNEILEGAVLRQGVDYDVPTRDMQSAIYAEAKRQGTRVKTRALKATAHLDEGIEVRKVRAAGWDWAFLLDGEPRAVFDGELRTTTRKGFIRQARRAADQRGLTIRVKAVSNGVWVQALKP